MAQTNKPPTALRNLAETAAALGISIRTLRRVIARGEVRVHRIGRSVRISDEDLASYLGRSRQ